jgi:CARDB
MRKNVYFMIIAVAALMPVAMTKPAAAADLRVGAPIQRAGPAMRVIHLPDLVIRAAAIRPTGDCRPGAPVLNVTVRVENIGNAASAAKAHVGMVQARDTGGVNWGNGHGLPALAPGHTVSVTFPIYYLQSNPTYMQGPHAFKVTVNAGKWIQESNYANNDFGPVNITLPPGFCGPKPDITSHKGPRIGGKAVAWGGSVTVGRKNAKRIQNGRCVFDFVYEMSNDGKADTSPQFVNRLREGGTLVAVNSGLHLKAGETQTLDTEQAMLSGRHVLSVSLDDGNAVAESNENNNLFRVIVNVDNSCGNARPAASLLVPKSKFQQ